jgi:hypothetical protein
VATRPAAPSRRELLRAAGALSAGLGVTLGGPRWLRGAEGDAPVRRVVVLHVPGGLRWTATFDGQRDPKHNPWGVLPWELVGRGSPPQWGFSRMLLQRPIRRVSNDWSTRVYPYLSSDDPAHYVLSDVPLAEPGWRGRRLPSFADLASDVAVVRVTSAPGSPFNGDHGSASHTLITGFRGGQNGVVTAMHHALKEQLRSEYDRRYPLPAVAIGEAAWSFGIGDHQGSRPIYLNAATSLPSSSAAARPAAWMTKAESLLDTPLLESRQAYARQAVANLVSDEAHGDAHLPQLVSPVLRLATTEPRGTASATLGTTRAGAPVTNGMLAEVFALGADTAPPGDITGDAVAAIRNVDGAWGPADNVFGLNGALAVRLLQAGAPLVSLTLGFWDSHANEVVDPSSHRSHAAQAVLLARTMAGLAFALREIEDPLSPSASLWDSTVVVACSEFGRGGEKIGPNGFNTPSGENGGGSDHDPWSAWPVFGGPVTRAGAGGRLLVSDGAGFYEQNRVFTTLMRGMGVDASASRYLPFGSFPVIPGLVKDTHA